MGFCDAFVPPFDLRSLNLTFPPFVLIVFEVAALDDIEFFPADNRVCFEILRGLLFAVPKLFETQSLPPQPVETVVAGNVIASKNVLADNSYRK